MVIDNPIVLTFYTTKKIIHLRVNASFFELNGWVADKRIYCGDFDPNIGGWSNKSKGEIMIKFEGDDQRTKCSIKILLQHNLTTIPDEDGDNSDDPSEPRTLENAPQPATNDPNKTQSGEDSSDEEGAHREEGIYRACNPPPPSLQSLLCTYPALFAFMPSDELFLPVADVPGPDSPAHWWLPDPAPGAGVAA